MASSAFAELEIAVRARGNGAADLDLRFREPTSATDVRPRPGELAPLHLDAEALRVASLDPDAYGELLFRALFADPAAARFYAQARAAAGALPLRLRFVTEPGPGLPPDLRWETLRDPENGHRLAVAERVLVSRYLAGADWRPVRPRTRAALRALVVIANPSDLADYAPGGRPLAPIDVDGELARARTALGDIPVTALASGGQATVERIVAALREGFDILYLVCHGALAGGEPRLWLEDAAGLCQIVPGADLAARIGELSQPPLLVFLASCQSAGGPAAATADSGALAALGPRLSAAGVPAVVAMQDNIAQATIEAFAPVFFRELARDGQVDRAVAAARAGVVAHDDWWVPVLFLRLRDGSIWAPTPPPTPLARRFLVGIGAVVLLVGALFSIALGSGLIRPPAQAPAATVGPPLLGGDLNIAVARLAAGDGAATSPEADRLGQAFAADLAAGIARPGVEVVYLPANGWPTGTAPVGVAAEAEVLAGATNADVVVYGSVAYDRQTDTSSLRPQFYLAPRKLFFDAGPQLVGHHQFGAPISERGRLSNSLTAQRLRDQLEERSSALLRVFDGLDAFVLGEYQLAEEAFAAAAATGALGDDSGQALIYLLRATAAGRAAEAGVPEAAAALDRAEQFYGEMLWISQRSQDGAATARARLGQAAVAFARGGECVPEGVPLFEQAIFLYEEAARTAMIADASRADVDAWSRFGQGRGHLCLAAALRGEPARARDELAAARELLNAVVGAYTAAEGTTRERLRYFAAEAYLNLGAVHLLRFTLSDGDAEPLVQARDALRSAVETTADPARRTFALLQLAYVGLQLDDCAAADTALAEAAAIERASRQNDPSPQDWARVDARFASLSDVRARAGCTGIMPERAQP